MEYRNLRGRVKGCQTLQSHQHSWAQPTSISMHWLQKVSHGISYMHHGPSMNLLARVPTELQLRLQGALKPRSLRTPGRTHAANTTRLRKTTHSTRTSLECYDSRRLCKMPTTWPCHIMAATHCRALIKRTILISRSLQPQPCPSLLPSQAHAPALRIFGAASVNQI